MKTIQKNVCYRCIGDQNVSDKIKAKRRIRKCYYCGQKGRSLTIAELSGIVDDAFRNVYSLGDEYPVVDNITDEKRYEQEGESPDIIIANMLGVEQNVKRFYIAVDVCEYLSSAEQLKSSQQDKKSFYDIDKKYVDLIEFHHEELWRKYCSNIKYHYRYFGDKSKKILRDIFCDIHEYFGVGIDGLVYDYTENKTKHIYRAREALNEDALKRILNEPEKELWMPPRAISRPGRMNSAGIPNFYGATNRDTCIAEVRPSVGNYVVSVKYKLLGSLNVLDLSILSDVWHNYSEFDPKYKEKISRLFFIINFGKEISKPISKDDELIGYIPTQYLVEYLAVHINPRLDGLIYSSPQTDDKGKNVLLFHDRVALHKQGKKKNSYSIGADEEVALSNCCQSGNANASTQDRVKNADNVREDDVEKKHLKLIGNSIRIDKITGAEYQSEQVDLYNQQ